MRVSAWRAWLVLFCTVILSGSQWGPSLSHAQVFFSTPSTGYTLLSAPLSPTSRDECTALDRAFDQELRTLNQQHDQCLAGTTRERPGAGTCSKPSCQALHTARDEAGERRHQEGRVCRDRVGEYQAEKRRQEEQERQARESAERQRREQENRIRERQREEREADRRQQEYRDQQAAKRAADRKRWDAEQEAELDRLQAEERAARDRQAESDRREREKRETQRERQRAETLANLERSEAEGRERQARRARLDAEEEAEQAKRELQDKDRELQAVRKELARRDAQDRARARQEAHDREVTETARQLKATWQEHIRTYLPDVRADVSSFKKIADDMRHGGGSYNRRNLIVATDKLLERAEQVYQWIRKPVEAGADHVMTTSLAPLKAEAIDKIWADHEYQRDNPLIQTIFRGIHKINALAHNSNPFTEKLSSTALEQIEAQVQKIQGELSQLEANLGSFHASQRYADQPIANPFKVTGTKPSSSHKQMDNPFHSLPPSAASDHDRKTETVAGCANPFRECSKKTSDATVPKQSARTAQ